MLQPEIHQFTSQLLPLLLEYLGHVTSGDALSRHGEANVSLTRTFYALEKFCESLGEYHYKVEYTVICFMQARMSFLTCPPLWRGSLSSIVMPLLL